MATATAHSPIDVERIRRDFPILSLRPHGHALVYLDNAATGQKPAQVIEATRRYYAEQNANVHRGVHYLSQLATDVYEGAREKVRGFINARETHEVIFTSGNTEAINLVAASYGRKNFGAGDEIVLTAMEHHSNIVPWQMLREEKGVVLRIAPVNDEGELTTSVSKGGWGIKKFNLDDLYVRFFRVAERRIAKTGMGVVSFISNYSWTTEPSFVVLRKRLLESFDSLWIENMHGNRKISEYAPDGRTSETVFAIPGHSPGIRQGVVVSVWVRKKDHVDKPGRHAKILYRNDIDAAKATERRQQLLDSLGTKRGFNKRYERAKPAPINRFSFRPLHVSEIYKNWPKLIWICKEPPICGYKENRGFAMIQDNKDNLTGLMRRYFDSRVSWEELAKLETGLTRNAASFDAKSVREKVTSVETFRLENVHRYTLRPFEQKWCYYSDVPPLWNRARPSLFQHHRLPNSYFAMRSVCVASPEGTPFFFTRCLGDFHSLRGQAHFFPHHLVRGDQAGKDEPNGQRVLEEAAPYFTTRANLSPTSRAYLKQFKFANPDSDATEAGLIWMHALAIGYSPAYLSENADGIRQDWPRIPLPATKKALLASAELGHRVAALLDTENAVKGVTAGKIDPRLASVAVVSRVGNGSLNPAEGHLDITAGWGHGGKGGVCMPGKGVSTSRKQTDKALRQSFGDETLDIYLNNVAYWSNVPRTVWEYYIGGYQVAKKWLSYRERSMLDRGLTMDEAEYFTEMCRRIAGVLLLQSELDANYEATKGDTWPWPESE